MRRLEDRKRAKVLKRACDKVSKGFWKAIKELTNKNDPKQNQQNTQNYSTDCVVVTDKEKNEMLKQLLKGNEKS